MKYIIFIDRDGVINKVTKGKYLNKVEDLEYIDGSLEAIEKLAKYSFEIYVITNQAGVAYGYLSEEELNKIHDKIMKDAKGAIKEILYCTHSKEAKCNCRNPIQSYVMIFLIHMKIQ
jgi:D-glycero-D-manno-heptose 1,7-bisphosphate phosphatase